MLVALNTPLLNAEDAARYAGWLRAAHAAAASYDGTEAAYEHVTASLNLADEFLKTAAGPGPERFALEEVFARAALNGGAEAMPLTISGMLDLASRSFDERLREAKAGDLPDVLKAGAYIEQTNHVFVQTDDGAINAPEGGGRKFEIKFQPRLSMLVTKLQGMGVYVDDLIIRTGKLHEGMVRQKPYTIVQIPRLNREIAVCDQVGEITFVARRLLDPLVWAHLSKDQLKAREDIAAVVFEHGDEDKWWSGIAAVLNGDGNALQNKIKVARYAKNKPPLDIELIKECIRAHRENTKSAEHQDGQWPTENTGEVKWGPYAGMKWGSLRDCLYNGYRGLPGGSSLAALKVEMGWFNDKDQKGLEIEKIKECIRLHRENTKSEKYPDGEWPAQSSVEVKWGPYKGMKWGTLGSHLRDGCRGLPRGSSLAALKVEMGWVNHLDKEDLEVEKIKECIRLHRENTKSQEHPEGIWPWRKSGEMKWGPYAGMKWGNLDVYLRNGNRGLPGGSSLKLLKDEIKREMAAAGLPEQNPPAP